MRNRRPYGLGDLPRTHAGRRGEHDINTPPNTHPAGDLLPFGGRGVAFPEYLQSPVNPAVQNPVMFTNFGYVVGTEGGLVLPGNPSRVYLLVRNPSAGTIYVSFGSPQEPGVALDIPSGGFYEPYVCPANGVYISGSVNGLGIVLIEGVQT